MISGIHHVGMGVNDINDAVSAYEGLGFHRIHEATYASIGRCVMVEKAGVRLELFQFDNPTSQLAQKITKHTALLTDNLDADLQAFLDGGFTVAIPIDDGDFVKRYAYVVDGLGNYLELCEAR